MEAMNKSTCQETVKRRKNIQILKEVYKSI